MNILKIGAMTIKHFYFHSYWGKKRINIGFERKLELSYCLLMSLIAKSCNSTSKLEMLVLHIVVLSAFATVVKINEVRIANSMGTATLKEKNTVPQNNKIFKHLW